MAAAETLAVVGAGAVLGLLVTTVNLAGMSAAPRLLSAPSALVVPWTAVGCTTGACALLALAASLTTTATALRRPPRREHGVRGAAGKARWRARTVTDEYAPRG